MADSTIEQYNELVGWLAVGQHPILPKPKWGQDAAFVAFELDSRANEIERLSQGLWDIFAILGGDTDGDETPRALTSDIVPLVKDLATEMRKERDGE